MSWAWAFALMLAGVFCIVRGVADLRRRRYVWGVLALVAAAVILSAPMPTTSLVLDIPAPQR
jgi:drug/metabolite transporter (DMT)-like permease